MPARKVSLEKVAEAITPDGGRLSLYAHNGSFCIRLNGLQLVHSAAPTSELLLGELGVEGLACRSAPRILIGGLGLGFTLKAVLGKVRPTARVELAELLADVVEWNKQFLLGLNGALLQDHRVEVILGDIWNLLARAAESSYDAVLLDVDNGPKALVHKQNSRLYSSDGLAQIALVLKPRGRAVFWSADPAPEFAERLAGAGFSVRAVPARFQPSAETCAGSIYLAEKMFEKSRILNPSRKSSAPPRLLLSG